MYLINPCEVVHIHDLPEPIDIQVYTGLDIGAWPGQVEFVNHS